MSSEKRIVSKINPNNPQAGSVGEKIGRVILANSEANSRLTPALSPPPPPPQQPSREESLVALKQKLRIEMMKKQENELSQSQTSNPPPPPSKLSSPLPSKGPNAPSKIFMKKTSAANQSLQTLLSPSSLSPPPSLPVSTPILSSPPISSPPVSAPPPPSSSALLTSLIAKNSSDSLPKKALPSPTPQTNTSSTVPLAKARTFTKKVPVPTLPSEAPKSTVLLSDSAPPKAISPLSTLPVSKAPSAPTLVPPPSKQPLSKPSPSPLLPPTKAVSSTPPPLPSSTKAPPVLSTKIPAPPAKVIPPSPVLSAPPLPSPSPSPSPSLPLTISPSPTPLSVKIPPGFPTSLPAKVPLPVKVPKSQGAPMGAKTVAPLAQSAPSVPSLAKAVPKTVASTVPGRGGDISPVPKEGDISPSSPRREESASVRLSEGEKATGDLQEGSEGGETRNEESKGENRTKRPIDVVGEENPMKKLKSATESKEMLDLEERHEKTEERREEGEDVRGEERRGEEREETITDIPSKRLTMGKRVFPKKALPVTLSQDAELLPSVPVVSEAPPLPMTSISPPPPRGKALARIRASATLPSESLPPHSEELPVTPKNASKKRVLVKKQATIPPVPAKVIPPPSGPPLKESQGAQEVYAGANEKTNYLITKYYENKMNRLLENKWENVLDASIVDPKVCSHSQFLSFIHAMELRTYKENNSLLETIALTKKEIESGIERSIAFAREMEEKKKRDREDFEATPEEENVAS